MLQTEPDVGIRGKMEDDVAAGHRGGQRRRIEDVAFHQFEFGMPSAPARNSRKPVLKLSKPVTEKPAASRRSARLLPMKPEAPVTNAFLFECAIRRCPDRSDELVAGGTGVIVKHLDGLERVLVQILAGQRQLGDDIRCRGDDVAAAGVSLRDVEHLARIAHSNSAFGRCDNRRSASVITGTGSIPVSAMRPANTETMVRDDGLTAFATTSTCSSVSIAVTLSEKPSFESVAISGPADWPLVLVMGILM